ncbi:unnamed protein product (macronuclear) [Paramecium tetraurelia]|uniref:ENTH domain-containing protein n=1 Tax=Paramecium tetraurelia TaxID=5888 RepID=A0BD68_PARTE|nr:uncharacterized protein GSPATT00004579001 [Paramecium tetraurelia]CAK56485.1 unnamed protein product [Paramecium tetraurelia]|eukprot:XP_001423883.1 hypothetical protein (macronuclear) [Paramecium tetraurelia strain d4-2]
MNSFRRVVTKTKTNIFLHKVSIDNVLREQLAALRLMQPKTQALKISNEDSRSTTKTMQIRDFSMKLIKTIYRKNDDVEVAGYQKILAELIYINNKKRSCYRDSRDTAIK